MATNKRLIKSNDEGGGAASFNTVLYTGTGAAQTISGVGFQPDFVWGKLRSSAGGHFQHDSVRGATKFLQSNTTNAEGTTTTGLNAFTSDGFQLGTDNGTWNSNGDTFVAWCWKAGGAAVTNTDGTITSQVSANTEAGFSIVSYTGTAVNNTIGHGLGIAPNVIIFKDRTIGRNWRVYHSAIGAGQNLKLNTSLPASSDAAIFQSTTPNENVFYVGASGDVNANTDNFIAYCFAEVAGFSKFGSYVGNGSVSGPTITTDFEPAFVLIKPSGPPNGNGQWLIYDNKRNPTNSRDKRIFANSSAFEYTDANHAVDFNADSFQIIGTDSGANRPGDTFIYMAFANQF